MSNTIMSQAGFWPYAGSSPSWLLLVPLLTFLLWRVWDQLASPLRNYPGPWLAKHTNIWRLYHTSRGSMHLVYQKLHEKYGPIIRVGPNVLDIVSPELVKPAFNDIRSEWSKTEFYHGSSALVNGTIIYNLFSQTDSKKHAKEKRPIAKYYSASAVASLEPHMDAMIEHLCHQLDSRFEASAQAFDLGQWLLYYAWDVVGAVTFSQPIGYLDKGHDFDGTLKNSETALDYFSVVGMIPALDYWFDKNPVMHIGPPGFNTVSQISLKHLIARYQGNDTEYHDPAKPDFLDRFIEAKNADPAAVDDGQIIGWLLNNMIAGADTTAATLKSAFYYSLRDPRIWQRLTQEIRAAAGVHSSQQPVSYKDACAIPYVEAVVLEALRILPGVLMPLERYVPQGGHRLVDGSFLPSGSIVGCNPYLLCRDEAIFGADVELFRPERWLRDEEKDQTADAFEARIAAMNSVSLCFGGGRRVCIGKHLGLFQVYKVLVTLVTLYEIEMVDPKKQWKVSNSWFVRQQGGLDVRVKKRTFVPDHEVG